MKYITYIGAFEFCLGYVWFVFFVFVDLIVCDFCLGGWGLFCFFVCLGWREWDVGICFFCFCLIDFFLWGSFLGFCFLLGWDFVYFCCLFLLLLLVWIGTWSVLYFYFGGIRDTCVFCFYFVFRGNLDQIFGWDVVLGDGEQVCFLFFGVNKLTLGNFMKPY